MVQSEAAAPLLESRRIVTPTVKEKMPVANAAGAMKVPGEGEKAREIV